MRPSYDEFFWLAIARKVALGGHLYRDAIDNKTPFVYGLSWLLDIVPGPYALARSLLLAASAAAVGCLASKVAQERTDSIGFGRLIGATVALVLVLQAQLVLTTELVATLLLLMSVAAALKGRVSAVVALAALAAAFDPRSLLMLPGIVALTWTTSGPGKGRQALTGLAATAGIGISVVLAVPDLRFALAELNLASRPALTAALFALSLSTGLRASLPLLTLWYLLRRSGITWRVALPEWLLLIGAVAIGVVSVQPFDHYWSFLLVPTPLFWRTAPVENRPMRPLISLVAMALVPLVAASASAAGRRLTTERHYVAIASAVGGSSYTSIDDQPYLAAMLPRGNRLRSPTLGYLTWQSSRQSVFLAELPDLIRASDVVVEDGILAVPRTAVRSPYREVWDAFMSVLPAYDCSQEVGSATLHRRCPTEGSHGEQ